MYYAPWIEIKYISIFLEKDLPEAGANVDPPSPSRDTDTRPPTKDQHTNPGYVFIKSRAHQSSESSVTIIAVSLCLYVLLNRIRAAR